MHFERKVWQEKSFRVAVMSDSQLSPFFWKKDNTFERNLRRACRRFAALSPDVLVFAGDICNIASKAAYARFRAAIEGAFGEKMPALFAIMGNHDYFPRPEIPALRRRKFVKETSLPPFWHYEVGGYHFIGVSPDCGSLFRGYEKIGAAMREEIEKAVAASGERPVTLITHNARPGTVYGSDDWGDKSLDFLKDYPTLLHISGHLHYSLLDERSIYIGENVCLGTQSTAYVEMEKGKANGSVPPDAHDAAMGYVLDYSLAGIEVKRINLVTGEEEKKERRLFIPAKGGKERLAALKASRPLPPPPVMSAVAGVSETKDGRTFLVFERGESEDLVHSYKVVYDTGEEQLYFSDFYRGGARLGGQMRLELFGMKKGVYSADVYALDSFGRESESAVHIDGITITKKRRYPLVFAPDARYL